MEDIAKPGDTPDEIAYKQIKLIAEVYNEGTVLDSMDTKQIKYYPWHEIDKGSGVGLSFDIFAFWYSYSTVGVRLCFENYDLAEYFGKQFIDLHTDHHLLT